MSHSTPDSTVLVKCECHSQDHLLVLEVVQWDEKDVSAYLFQQMTPIYGFFKRLWRAVDYILHPGRCRYGHWQETLIDRESARAMRDALDVYLQVKK